LNEVTGNFQVALSSFSTNYVSYIDYISSATGILNQVSTTLFLSSISSVYLYGGQISQFSAGTIVYDQNDVSTLSTATNTRIISTASTLALQSQGNLVSTFSTILGLGTLGYVSSTQLFSTVAGLGTLGYISSHQLFSTVEGLGTAGYISTSYSDNLLQSTVKGVNDTLGSYGYISSQSLASTLQSTTQGIVNGLGSAGYISTQSLESTVIGVNNTFGQVYISTTGLNSILNSTIEGLGTLGYISVATLDLALTSSFNAIFQYNLISTPNLVSTIDHLGSLGYVSTASLTSSLIGTQRTLLNIRSSILYSGNMGDMGDNFMTATGSELYFSSANFTIDPFSSFIQTNSQISFDANLNFVFPSTNVGFSGLYEVSSFIQCEDLVVPRATYSDTFFGNGSFSNSYSKLITMNIDTAYTINNFTKRYALAHKLKGATLDATTAFARKASIYMASTNSLFFTIMKSQAEPCSISEGGGGGGGGI
jgi:hypothetical protein